MRTLSSTGISALETPFSYKLTIDASLEQTLIFFDSILENHAGYSGSPAWSDTPTLEEIGLPTSGSAGVSSWINDGGTLKYQIVGDSSVVSTGQAISGKPGIFGSKIFFVQSGTLKRFDISWSAVASKSTTPLSNAATIDATNYTSGSPMVSGISETECVIFAWANGGVRASYHILSGSWIRYPMANRFMFPKAVKYADVERSQSSLMVFSTAIKLGDEVYAYISNAGTGGADGCCWNHDTLKWGDIYKAVPSDINSNLSEFRISNSYVAGDSAFIVGQFLRRNEAEGYVPYTLICRSTDGRSFSLGRASLVSNLGWRFLAGSYMNQIWVNAGNRVSWTPATYHYLGMSGSGPSGIPIPDTSIKTFTDNSLQTAELDLKAGDEYYMTHPNMKAGARLQVRMGIKTSTGYEIIPWGSYIIDGFEGGVIDGNRKIQPRLVNESTWNLAGMSSPYYTEMISKSSLVDPMKDYTYMYTAGSSGMVEQSFSVDFWDSRPPDVPGLGVSPYVIVYKGGAAGGHSTSNHKIGFKTKDLMDLLDLYQYPMFASSSVHMHIYGWSSNRDGSINDSVSVILYCKDTDDNEYQLTSGSGRFPNTYKNSASGDYPIEASVDVTVGDRLIAIGLIYECAHETYFNAARVDVISGCNIYTENTDPWEIEKGIGFKLPGPNQPYIMFSRKPYDAFNFIIGGTFNQNITGTVTGMPASYGLVGLALDASNYVCARYNVTNSKLEIVKAVDRVESVLTDVSASLTGDVEMMFRHTDGHFVVYIKSAGIWQSQLTYDWTNADGWMFKDMKQSMHCGIYGYIKMPHFYTTGFDMGANEDETNSWGVPMLPDTPISWLSDWPTSGSCVIDGNVYHYDGKRNPANSEIRGPYQFRQNGDGTEGHFTPPYGTGEPGLECLDFDWLKSAGYGTNSIIAVDDGGNYQCTDTYWTIWITTGGEVQYIRDRARYYASDSPVGTSYHDLSNRVYLTGGLYGMQLVRGEVQYHGWHTLVHKFYDGNIYCKGFFGSSGDMDVSVEDLIDKISRLCGSVAEFPGDTEVADISLTGTPYSIQSDNLAEGFDVNFTIDQMSASDYVQLDSDTQARGYAEATTAVRVTSSGGGAYTVDFRHGSTVIETYAFTLPDTKHRTRVLYHDNFVSVYMDDMWIYTFGIAPFKDTADPIHDIPGIAYSSNVGVRVSSNHTGLHIRDLRIAEMFDWREAVYIDLDTDGQAAIQNVIQQRPVEIICKSNGSLAYMYAPVRDEITQVQKNIRSHTWDEQYPKNAASDAIVYYVDVKTLQDAEFAKRYGLSTKVYRMPDLTTGAVKAAKIALRRYLEGAVMHTIEMRPDIRIEAGDILHITYTASGTGTVWSTDIIVETADMTFDPDGSTMRVKGREQIL